MVQTKIFLILIATFSFQYSYGQNLEKHRWKNRILLVKTNDASEKIYRQQLEELDRLTNGFIERRLVLYTIVKNDFVFTDYKDRTQNHSGKIPKKFAERMLKEQEDFEVLLIGLDGHIKLRQTKLLTGAALFRTIDAMPMRRSEIKN